MALAGAVAAVPEGEQYQFDPSELLLNNAGLAEAGSIVNGIASDKALRRALANGGPQEPEEESNPEPSGPSDDEMDEYMN